MDIVYALDFPPLVYCSFFVFANGLSSRSQDAPVFNGLFCRPSPTENFFVLCGTRMIHSALLHWSVFYQAKFLIWPIRKRMCSPIKRILLQSEETSQSVAILRKAKILAAVQKPKNSAFRGLINSF